MFVKKIKDVTALDEKTLRKGADEALGKVAGPLRRLQLTTLTAMGVFLVTGAAGMILAPAFMIASVAATAGAASAVFAWNVLHDRACRAEAERLNKAADKRVELDNLARQAAEEYPQKAIVLPAPAVVYTPLKLKKAPSPKAL